MRVDPGGPLLVSVGGAVDAAVAGAGVVHLFEGWLRPHLASGALEPVLEVFCNLATEPLFFLNNLEARVLYELATLSCPLLSLNQAAKGADAWVKDGDAKGELLGCWRTEIGTLGRLLVLRGFEQPHDMTEERHRALHSANPFNAGSLITALEMDSYAPLPFLPAIRTGDRGGVYEFRTYRLKPGGLPATLAGWKAAIEPAKEYTDHLVTNMYALDGPPRITHVWGFASLQERGALRARAYAAGVWPPKGGPEQIAEATSTIALPQSGSPLA